MADGKLTKVGALWLQEKAGRKYMSGKLDKELAAGVRVFVYKNDHKTSEKHPDYTLHAIVDDEFNQAPPEENNEREGFF